MRCHPWDNVDRYNTSYVFSPQNENFGDERPNIFRCENKFDSDFLKARAHHPFPESCVEIQSKKQADREFFRNHNFRTYFYTGKKLPSKESALNIVFHMRCHG